MEIKRHHYFIAGVIILFLGIQFRYIESFTLNEESSRFIAEHLRRSERPATATLSSLFRVSPSPSSMRNVQPPRWLGFSLLSLGAVLVLHGAVMRKPGT